jgi:hypothetical protein
VYFDDCGCSESVFSFDGEVDYVNYRAIHRLIRHKSAHLQDRYPTTPIRLSQYENHSGRIELQWTTLAFSSTCGFDFWNINSVKTWSHLDFVLHDVLCVCCAIRRSFANTIYTLWGSPLNVLGMVRRSLRGYPIKIARRWMMGATNIHHNLL